jgi:hypothetical protein
MSTCTAVYYPPVWKDGVNINPDRNTTTTKAHCYECNYDFVIKSCGGETWTEQGQYNPPEPPSDVNITVVPSDYVPIETETAIATINIKTEEIVRDKYQWEIDIEDLQRQMKEVKEALQRLEVNMSNGHSDLVETTQM